MNQMFKTKTKIRAKILRATNFPIVKLEKRKLNGMQKLKVKILIVNQKLFPNFGGTDNNFAFCGH